MTTDTVKHTPGPWRVGAPPDKVCTNYGGEADIAKGGWGKVIVTCKRSSWMGEGEGFANAQLIAAAPELLEALKELADYHSADLTSDFGNEAGRMRNALAAIAKAEGRS